MNGTPQLRSAFPQSPQTLGRDGRRQTASPAVATPQNVNVTNASRPAQPGADGPLIPIDVIDAPSQRFYVAALYIALGAWRMYDSMGAADELDSTWLFLKWNFIDGVFLFGIQALRVPWLEWTFPTFLAIFLLHAAANVFLMFRIPIPLGAWGGILWKVFYDRELSISERSVKPGDIIHNASLILGKQIIHILPEGSAVLNPDGRPLCLNSQQTTVALPMRINQTSPILLEILRYDLSTGHNETISISHKQLKSMKKQAGESAADGHIDLYFPIKKTGIYRLARVLDESNLEVQIKASDMLVPACPRAVPKNTFVDKCKGDLSDINLEVEGVAPLKVKYSRRINGFDGGFSFQNVHAEGSLVPITSRKPSGILIDPKQPDTPFWAHTVNLRIALNETLDASGEWVYTIEEVHDAQGNVANYSSYLDDTDRASLKGVLQWHQFSVHERPRLSMIGCNAQKFLQTAKGETAELPLHFHSTGRDYSDDAPFQVTYSYSNREETDSQSDVSKIRQISLKTAESRPKIKEPGWYTLESASSRFCRGEILEPSSCLLHNPPEPELSLRQEKLFDKCANNSVGLLVDLDMIGSPPFRLRYSIESDKGTKTFSEVISGLRGQLDFTPTEAGRYRYRFLDIADSVYGPQPLKDKVQVLEQDVKPQASAHLIGTHKPQRTCFGESATVGVSFIGEAPWILQYEVVHNGKKTKHEIESHESLATIVTEPLYSGGEHIISLTGVTDRLNCKRALKDSTVVHVRPKKPQASFGFIEEKRTTQALEGKTVSLPLRLSGQAPWIVKYRNLDVNPGRIFEKKLWDENGAIPVSQNGVYELIEVFDATCPGNIEESASTFEIKWIPRPAVYVPGRTGVGENVSKRSVCQGDDDILELKLEGKAPFNVKYEHHERAGVKVRNLKSTSNVASLELDTSKSGNHVYKFIGISDALYDADPKEQNQISISQTVNALPSARFESPGHIYAFCKEDSDGDELIPIVLEGQPPFYLDISIKHHSSAKPEVVPVGPIHSHKHKLPIPRRHLELGQHVVSIHRVGDSLGCQRIFEKDLSSVRVVVSDVPTIIPLESQTDYCVGERLSFSLSGHAPFDVFYTFEGVKRKASSHTTTFRRIAEKPGVFTITAVSDGASGRCQAHKNITKVIHEMPSVRISRGRESIVDIHEGGEAEINFEFGGTPPFEFTYTRSSNARKGKPAEILDIKHDISYEYKKTIKTSDEGTYEVVAIKDKYCSFSTQKASAKIAKQTKKSITN
ncbi:nuclear envelope pore membrane protein, putative [Talaromyces stipitatus ATCC 10500]|uniref:Nuclear envelope pore membrane protein, putative n=1 Tax=Talaromyces stipitatus (strain ATCC 10500 / CBS 375.48 / QM 6759 / NRRL 1006) TaxID=441959 RepID=B8MNR6_TALSN|nr:nuclear envelope pore membrane protein, putative [Talaromyces stipitatus ATCC 10500]EED14155.1 nuclear envelope pore membrane protein, putative [Talaromyces stipitatus ATCC 10500]